MKFICLFAVLLLLIGCSSHCNGAAVTKPTGQPGCQTEQELTEVYYQHFYLKNAYWTCSTLGVPATLVRCPLAEGYLPAVKRCVPFMDWYWTPTELPPSQPAEAAAYP
ncbi:hypothetical protein KR018_003791 [Drosophila ironensis]|nr:hypothetical protein KR018_003791 [Drosophila ironensis]